MSQREQTVNSEEKSVLLDNPEKNVDQTKHVTDQPEDLLRRSERQRTLTDKGKELHIDKLKGLLRRFEGSYDRWKALTKVAKKAVNKQDPNDTLQEHISSIQKVLSELNVVYDDYRKLDGPPQEMRRKMDNCISITHQVVENAQAQIEGNREDLMWPDAPSVFATTISSGIKSVKGGISVCTTQSEAKRKEAAAEYAATRAVLQIMLEQDQHQERLISLETENRSIVAAEEANALNRRLQAEREDAERKVKEASLLKKQQEEYATRQKAVEHVKRELERLEELKRLNAAKARLQGYDEVDPDQGSEAQYSELPKVEQAVKYQYPVYHYTQPCYNPAR